MNRSKIPPLSRRTFLSWVLGSAGVGMGLSWMGLRPSRHPLTPSTLPKLYQSQQRMMGTWISLSVFAHQEEQALGAMHDALLAMRVVDNLMSIHKKSSEVCCLNKASGNHMIPVNPHVIEVLDRAHYFSEKSEGAYDITILPLMKLFGFYTTPPNRIPRDIEIAVALESVNHRHLVIDRENHRVGLKKKHSAIDLGSIGKGFAVDCAAHVLRQQGIRSALIDAGGNLYALGAPYEDPDPRAGWRIGIKNPRLPHTPHPLETLSLRDQAVATSASYYHHVDIGSTEISHIIHARTGHPCSPQGSCTVISPNAMDADALSTVGYILGPQKTKPLFETPQTQFYFYA